MVVTRKEWGVEQGHVEVFQSALHHAVDVAACDGLAREFALFLERALEERRILSVLRAGQRRRDIPNHFLRIVPDGNLPRLAAFLPEANHSLIPGIVEIPPF